MGKARSPKRSEWQLQDAKGHFSEVFRLAREQGPQRVTKRGGGSVVIIPAEEFERLSGEGNRRGNLVRFFALSPLRGSGIDLDRRPDFPKSD